MKRFDMKLLLVSTLGLAFVANMAVAAGPNNPPPMPSPLPGLSGSGPNDAPPGADDDSHSPMPLPGGMSGLSDAPPGVDDDSAGPPPPKSTKPKGSDAPTSLPLLGGMSGPPGADDDSHSPMPLPGGMSGPPGADDDSAGPPPPKSTKPKAADAPPSLPLPSGMSGPPGADKDSVGPPPPKATKPKVADAPPPLPKVKKSKDMNDLSLPKPLPSSSPEKAEKEKVENNLPSPEDHKPKLLLPSSMGPSKGLADKLSPVEHVSHKVSVQKKAGFGEGVPATIQHLPHDGLIAGSAPSIDAKPKDSVTDNKALVKQLVGRRQGETNDSYLKRLKAMKKETLGEMLERMKSKDLANFIMHVDRAIAKVEKKAAPVFVVNKPEDLDLPVEQPEIIENKPFDMEELVARPIWYREHIMDFARNKLDDKIGLWNLDAKVAPVDYAMSEFTNKLGNFSKSIQYPVKSRVGKLLAIKIIRDVLNEREQEIRSRWGSII